MGLFQDAPKKARSFPTIPVYIDYRVHPRDLNVPVLAVGKKPEYRIPGLPDKNSVTAEEYIQYINQQQNAYREGEQLQRPRIAESNITEETAFQAQSKTHRRTPFGAGFSRDPIPKTYKSRYLCCDVNALRVKFESIATTQDLRLFLSECGSFTGIDYLEKNDPVSLLQVREWQYYFAKSKLRGRLRKDYPLPDWFAAQNTNRKYMADMLFNFNWKVRIEHPIRPELYQQDRSLPQPGQLAIWVYCISAIQAIGASVQLDILSGIQWRECAHCGTAFQLGHKPEKMFCDIVCKHASGQRRRRALVKTTDLTSA